MNNRKKEEIFIHNKWIQNILKNGENHGDSTNLSIITNENIYE